MGDTSEIFGGPRLLPIGQFARLAGMNVKALRYYDRVGALRPARVHRLTGYRAYAPWQLRVAEAIELGVDFGLPLRRFAPRYLEGRRAIRYGRLVEDGLAEAEARLRELRARVRLLRELRALMAHGDALAAAEDGTLGPCRLPGWVCRTAPCAPDADPDAVFRRLVADLLADGLRVGYDSGALLLRQGGETRRFLYATLRPPIPKGTRGLFRVPAGDWLCAASDRPLLDPDARLPAPFRDGDALIVERDLFTSDFAIAPPRLEWLRGPLPPRTP